MSHVTPGTLGDAFERLAEAAPDARMRELMVALARHLHDFVRETRLTPAEWQAGCEALLAAGRISGDERNEFVLFSDLLGVSALVDMLNTPPGATSSSNLGPFHVRGSPPLANGGDLWRGQAGEVLAVEGQVVDAADGHGLGGATLDLWQNADSGLYSVADASQPAGNYRGLMRCDDQGRFCFTTTAWKPYTVPYDGPAGVMLRALGRDAWRAAHLHVIAEHPGYRPVVTELFLAGDPWLAKDAVFGVRDDLVLEVEPVDDRGSLPAGLEALGRLPQRLGRVRVTLRLARSA